MDRSCRLIMSGLLMGLMTSALSVCASRQMQAQQGYGWLFWSLINQLHFGFVKLIVLNCLLLPGWARSLPLH
uniref:Uncharacterized protein n=1 Tax=Hippocampus comes TaxID=109280 RepID=A0A3Q2X7M2_HIPCM